VFCDVFCVVLNFCCVLRVWCVCLLSFFWNLLCMCCVCVGGLVFLCVCVLRGVYCACMCMCVHKCVWFGVCYLCFVVW